MFLQAGVCGLVYLDHYYSLSSLLLSCRTLPLFINPFLSQNRSSELLWLLQFGKPLPDSHDKLRMLGWRALNKLEITYRSFTSLPHSILG